MRTVSDLAKMNGRVYVYCCNNTVMTKFVMDAAKEGFEFGDGMTPLERPLNDIYRVNRNHTLNFVGWAGHMAFHNPDRVIGDPLIRVDYEKYILGLEDFIVK